MVLLAEPFRDISSHVLLLTGTIVKDFEIGRKLLEIFFLVEPGSGLRMLTGLSDSTRAWNLSLSFTIL